MIAFQAVTDEVFQGLMTQLEIVRARQSKTIRAMRDVFGNPSGREMQPIDGLQEMQRYAIDLLRESVELDRLQEMIARTGRSRHSPLDAEDIEHRRRSCVTELAAELKLWRDGWPVSP